MYDIGVNSSAVDPLIIAPPPPPKKKNENKVKIDLEGLSLSAIHWTT